MNQCEGCELSHFGNKYRVCIPPPSGRIRGCLISRDPSSKFLKPLKEYGNLPTDQKGNLWFKAPPIWLFKKINKIMKFPDNSPDLIKLQDFLNRECYWTHLHKCPTKPQTNQEIDQDGMNGLKEDCPQFRYPAAKSCANRWFKSEFSKYNLNDKIIITLGRDVENFFKSWSTSHGLECSNKIINLPHPSGRCRSWNETSNQTEQITKEINRLLNLI